MPLSNGGQAWPAVFSGPPSCPALLQPVRWVGYGLVGHSGQRGVLPHKIPSTDGVLLVAVGLVRGAQCSGDSDAVNGWPVTNMLGARCRFLMAIGAQGPAMHSVRSRSQQWADAR
jgi:hypothetical protein